MSAHRARELAGSGSETEKLYVTAIDPARAEVRVGPRTLAERAELELRDLRWLAAPRARFTAAVQVRHRGAAVPADIVVDGDRARVVLESPTIAAPGQAAVIYDGDRVLAGGWIARA